MRAAVGHESAARYGRRAARVGGRALKTLLHPALLAATAVTVLAYAGSFSAYTYVAPLLLDTTGVDVRAVGMYMLAYGLFAAIGNALGGRLTDSLGVQRASVAIVAGIGAASLGMWAGARSPWRWAWRSLRWACSPMRCRAAGPADGHRQAARAQAQGGRRAEHRGL